MTGFGKDGFVGRMSRIGRRLALAALLSTTAAGVAAAQNPSAPSVKPAQTVKSAWLETGELTLLARAMDAADDGRWGEVFGAQNRLTDPGAQALLRWRTVTDASAASGFSELTKAMADFKGWPDYDKIVQQAEVAIGRNGMAAEDKIAWLKANGPKTGDGIFALADALKAQGKRDEAVEVIRNAWRTRAMTPDVAQRILGVWSADLTPDDHFARADMFLWRDDQKSAVAMESRVSSGRKKLLDARIALMQNKKKIDPILAAVPAEYADDPGLLLERARWRERRGQEDGELELLLKINGAAAPEVAREEIWSEKQSVMRRLIREGDYATAYQLAANHGLTTGEAFRDAEWTAGWLQLAKLHDPVKAEAHFRVFGAGVTTPISVSRAQYWLGEALTKQNKVDDAKIAYATAAKYPYVFYGQLAAEKLKDDVPDLGKLYFVSIAAPTDEERAAFAKQPEVRAAILLAETGRLGTFERFSFALDDTLQTAAEHQMLFDIAAGYLEMRAAVRGAKAGLGRGLVAPDAVYPLLDLPQSPRSGSAEPAMVLALSRQESEFNAQAVSTADARGLMQMVPAYAKAEAKEVGMPYRQSWLTDDPAYNLRLGRGFLDDLVDSYNGSYLLAAAAYNAGPSRVRQWMRDLGDPRGDADPVDWIESIPFSETRNYVMRVLENTQVYRQRLAKAPVDIKLMEDLKRGHP
ncbi:MAG TPA: transglycosylase SLT domain-containing protein [Hyphomonadaceae bacterium]|nr:transglycosylase SLT domain-containing protein [Hyphomonadaceae bacterium]